CAQSRTGALTSVTPSRARAPSRQAPGDGLGRLLIGSHAVLLEVVVERVPLRRHAPDLRLEHRRPLLHRRLQVAFAVAGRGDVDRLAEARLEAVARRVADEGGDDRRTG